MEPRTRHFETQHKLLLLETLYDAGLSLGALPDEEALVEDVLSRVVGVLDASRGYLATFAADGTRKAEARVGFPKRPTEAAVAQDEFLRDVLDAEGAIARDKFKLLGRPVLAAVGARIFGGGRPLGVIVLADKEAPARRPGRVRRRGRALPRLPRGPLRHGDREPPAPRAAHARARAPRRGEPPAPRRDRPVRRGPPLRGRFAGGPPGARPGIARGELEDVRASDGGERHRQGAGRAHDPRPKRPGRKALRGDQLRGASRDAPGVRALRHRARSRHRRRGPGRQVRDRAGRDDLPGRDRRHAAVASGQAAAGPPGTGDRAGRRPAPRSHRRPGPRGHARAVAGAHRARRVP